MDDRTQVLRAAEARADALAAGDADRLGRLLHESFRWTSHAGETFDREQYIARNSGGLVRWLSQDLESVMVTVVGDTAVLHAQVSDVIRSETEPQTFRMPVTQVWVREAGAWLCLAGHAGPRSE